MNLRLDRQPSWRIGLYLLPAFVLFAFFVVMPVLSALGLAFFRADGLVQRDWVGFGNFLQLFHDPLFWRSLMNLVVFAVIGVPVQTFGPLLGAKLLYALRSGRAAYWYRTLLVFP